MDRSDDTEGLSYTIEGPNDVGDRLDAFLARQRPELNRSSVRRLIDAGHVRHNGAPPKKAGVKLRQGDRVELTIPTDPLDKAPMAEDIPLEIVYADDDLAVVNKPSGLVVHPSKGHATGTLVNALLHHLPSLSTGGAMERPGIVHRLDMDTSGLLVVAMNEASHRGLQGQFADHSIERSYVAVVFGPRIDDGGTYRTLYGRHPRDRKKMSSKVETGKEAITHWEVLARSQAMALVQLRLETGRTHQIRVHLSDNGHPVVGDPLYGRVVPKAGGGRLAVELAAARRLPRQALHAQRLGFIHPTSGEKAVFGSQVPEDMAVLIETCFGLEVLESLGP